MVLFWHFFCVIKREEVYLKSEDEKDSCIEEFGNVISNVFSGLSYFISVYRAPRVGRQRTGYRLFSLTAYLLIFR